MTPLQHIPTAEDLKAAQDRIAPYIHRTPVFHSQKFNDRVESHCVFKGEHLQKTGAFKARGAMNAVLVHKEHAKGRGFVTHSSGNHGAALAWAAAIQRRTPAENRCVQSSRRNECCTGP